MIPELAATEGFNTQKQVKKHKNLYEPKNNAYDDPKLYFNEWSGTVLNK